MLYQKIAKLSHVPVFVWTKEKRVCWLDSNFNEFSIEVKSGFFLGSKEQDIYTAIIEMMSSIQQLEIRINAKDILKKMKWQCSSYTTVKKGIEKIMKTLYIFKNCLVAGATIETKILNIKAKGKGKNAFYIVSLPLVFADMPKFPYCYEQYLDFPPGIARRTYEIIKKNDRLNLLEIGIDKLTLWLGIRSKKTSDKRKTINSALDKIQAAGLISSYEYSPAKKQYKIVYPQAEQKQQQQKTAASKTPPPPTDQQPPTQEIQKLLAKAQNRPVRKLIEKYVAAKGYTYVENNINYANDYAKENYEGYLNRALANNYAGEGYISREDQQKQKEKENQEQAKEVEQRVREAIERQKKSEEIKTYLRQYEPNFALFDEVKKAVGNIPMAGKKIRLEYTKIALNQSHVKYDDIEDTELLYLSKYVNLPNQDEIDRRIREEESNKNMANMPAGAIKDAAISCLSENRQAQIYRLIEEDQERKIMTAIENDGQLPYKTYLKEAVMESRDKTKQDIMQKFVLRVFDAFEFDRPKKNLLPLAERVCALLREKDLLS